MKWLRVLLGPLAASVILLPVLWAGGVGVFFAIIGTVMTDGLASPGTWMTLAYLLSILLWVASATVGTAALWAAVLASDAELRGPSMRRRLVVGLVLGLAAAVVWLGVMARGDRWGSEVWAVWLGLLVGPILYSLYYLARLLAPR